MLKLKKNIYIFLNNKIISCDTILPLLLETKSKNPSINIIFYCFSYQTYLFLKKNTLLIKGIEEIGYLKCLTRENTKNWHKYKIYRVFHLLKVFPTLLNITFNILFRNTYVIHFKALNFWPFIFLYYINKNNTIYSDSDSSGWSLSFFKADNAIHEREDPNKEFLMSSVPDFKGKAPRGKRVISFSSNWPILKHPALKDSQKFIISAPHKRSYWINYLKKNADYLIDRELNINNKQEFCVLLLGHIGKEVDGARYLKNENDWTTLVENILDIIHDVWPNIIILIKPHIITDMLVLKNILSTRKHINTKITYLHPALLAVNSKFFVAIVYTSAFQSVSNMNAVTIEYTNQKEEYLKMANYKSIRPEYTTYFFNDDEEGFRDILIDLKNKPNNKLPLGINTDDSGLIKYLSS